MLTVYNAKLNILNEYSVYSIWNKTVSLRKKKLKFINVNTMTFVGSRWFTN